jgi:hypothetical protein
MAQKASFFIDGVIVDPDSKSRHALRASTNAVVNFRKVSPTTHLEEALTTIKSLDFCDFVLLSSSFGFDEIFHFMERSKTTIKGAEATYIVVVKSADKNERLLAEALIKGIHGFLFEPYSVDGLQEIANLSDKVRNDHADKRKKAAIRLLISNIIREFDKMSAYLKRGFNVDRARKKFYEACEGLRAIDDGAYSSYLDIAIGMFDSTIPPKLGSDSYVGVSHRVRQRLERKLLEEFEKETQESNASDSKIDTKK